MLADIGIGIFSAILASRLFQTKLTLLTVLIGIVFALLPDMDFLVEWIKRKRMPGKFSHEHRNLFHLPLFYISIGSFIVFWFGWIYLFLFVFNSLLHFLHDSFGIGWGIKWTYPLSEKTHKFFFLKKFINSWNEDELREIVEKYGDPNWIKNIYLRPTLISITELTVFLISLAVLFLEL